MHKSMQSTISVCSVFTRRRRLHPCSSISHRSSDTVPNSACASEQRANWDKLIRDSDTVSRLEGSPVLTDSLGHTQASQPFYPSKAVKATILHSSKGQGLAHVSAAKVIDACHPSLNVAHTHTHTSRQNLISSHVHVTYAVTTQCERNDRLSCSRS